MGLEITPLLITLFLYPGPEDVVAACHNLGIEQAVAGCAVKRGNTCEVHVARLPLDYKARDFEVMGHEFYHCRFPDFHATGLQDVQFRR